MKGGEFPTNINEAYEFVLRTLKVCPIVAISVVG